MEVQPRDQTMITPRRRGLIRMPVAAVAALLVVTGCATAPLGSGAPPPQRDGMLLTREEIAKTGAENAWEAIRLGATHLNIQFPREGSPARVTHRGTDSFIINPEVLLVVDGTHMSSLSYLQDIRVENIEYIQILSASAGTVRYGTEAGNGVIVVKTNPPPGIG
jgi:hypothetical protein